MPGHDEDLILAAERHFAALQAIFERLRAAAREPDDNDVGAPTPPLESNPRFEIAATALRRNGFEFDDQKVRRICARHSGEDDFAVNLGLGAFGCHNSMSLQKR